jgi:hypothetical protein
MLDELDNKVLQQAVRENLVSFPAQVPVFVKQSRPDLQPKLAALYFVHMWTMDKVARRYGMKRSRVGQILDAWRTRAVKEGHIQSIVPEALCSSRRGWNALFKSWTSQKR